MIKCKQVGKDLYLKCINTINESKIRKTKRIQITETIQLIYDKIFYIVCYQENGIKTIMRDTFILYQIGKIKKSYNSKVGVNQFKPLDTANGNKN